MDTRQRIAANAADGWFEQNAPTTQPVAREPGPTSNVNGLVTDPRNAAGRGTSAEQYYRDYIQNFGVKLKQADPAGWSKLVADMRNEGYDVSLDSRPDGMHKGIMMNDQFIKLADGNDNPIWLPGGDAPGGGEKGQQQPFTYPTFDEKFAYQPFEAPTDVTEQNDPGFKARLQMGEEALQRSAAAQGTLLTGGTLKDLQQFGQDYASNEYGKVYDRAAQTWGTNYNKAATEYNNRYGQYLGGFNNAMAAYSTNFNTDQALWGRAFNQNQQGFAQLYDLASLGLTAANGTNTGSQHHADAAGNLITGAGNADAAGQVGGANAWTNAFGNLANYAQYASLYRSQPPTPPWQGVPHR